MKTTDLFSTFLDRLNLLLAALVATVGVRVRERAMGVGIGEVVYWRVQRARNLVTDLIRRLQAGTLRAWLRRAAVARERPKVERGPRKGVLVPRRPGWVCPLMPCTERYRDSAALYAAQLAALLQEAEVRRLLAMAPQIGEALRPVCRMLGVDPGLLEPKDVPEADVAPAARPAPVVDEDLREAGVVVPLLQQNWAQ